MLQQHILCCPVVVHTGQGCRICNFAKIAVSFLPSVNVCDCFYTWVQFLSCAVGVLTCRGALSSSSCEERLLYSTMKGAPLLPLPFCSFSNAQCFLNTQQAVTDSSWCGLVSKIKTDFLPGLRLNDRVLHKHVSQVSQIPLICRVLLHCDETLNSNYIFCSCHALWFQQQNCLYLSILRLNSLLPHLFNSRDGSTMFVRVPSQGRGTTSRPAPVLWLSMLIKLVRQKLMLQKKKISLVMVPLWRRADFHSLVGFFLLFLPEWTEEVKSELVSFLVTYWHEVHIFVAKC